MQKRNFSESKNCAKNEEESLGEREGGHNLEIRKQGGGGGEGLFAKPLAKITATLNPSTFHFSYNNIHIIK